MSQQSSGTAQGESDEFSSGGGNTAKLAIAWTVVGVPLAYGIVQVVIRASQLFTS